MSFSDKNKMNENDFLQIEESYRSINRRYLIGTILLNDLQNSLWFNHPDVSVIALEDEPVNENQLVNTALSAVEDATAQALLV